MQTCCMKSGDARKKNQRSYRKDHGQHRGPFLMPYTFGSRARRSCFECRGHIAFADQGDADRMTIHHGKGR